MANWKLMLGLVALPLATASCTAIPAAAIYAGSLTGVERSAGLYLAQTNPDVATEAGIACITGAMRRGEIVRLGSKDTRVLTPEIRATLDEVAARPDAANCLAATPTTAA